MKTIYTYEPTENNITLFYMANIYQSKGVYSFCLLTQIDRLAQE